MVTNVMMVIPHGLCTGKQGNLPMLEGYLPKLATLSIVYCNPKGMKSRSNHDSRIAFFVSLLGFLKIFSLFHCRLHQVFPNKAVTPVKSWFHPCKDCLGILANIWASTLLYHFCGHHKQKLVVSTFYLQQLSEAPHGPEEFAAGLSHSCPHHLNHLKHLNQQE